MLRMLGIISVLKMKKVLITSEPDKEIRITLVFSIEWLL